MNKYYYLLIQTLPEIKKQLNVEMIKKWYRETILHILCDRPIVDVDVNPLEKVKYVFKFCKKHHPILFLEDGVNQNTFLNYLYYYNFDYLDLTKYVFKFCIQNFPSLFSRKNEDGYIIFSPLRYYDASVGGIPKYMVDFTTLNFPEHSRITNNFIFPLMMEIQN